MKKRYLSMLMAVVLCLGLFTTGALAASGEVEAAAPGESAEPVMDGQPSETPAENAEPGETTQTQALDGAGDYPGPNLGVVIEGFGGTVVYFPGKPLKDEFNFIGNPSGVSHSRTDEGPDSRIIITCDESTTAGTYHFYQICEDLNYFLGQFSVLTLAEAKEAGKLSYEGFNLYKYTGTEASPTPLAGAVFGLYTSDPNDPAADAAPSPVATFTTDANGAATITLENLQNGDLPQGTGKEKTYFLKEITAPDGYARSDTVWEVKGHAEWEIVGFDATTGLKFVLEHPEDSGDGMTEAEWKDDTLWVYNERYVSLSFDIEKTVESKGAQPGTNTFTFLVAVDSGDGAPTVSFTPKGGEPIEPEFVPNPAGEEEAPSERSFSPVRCYTVPLTVSGTGTAGGTFTISGRESELLGCTAEVYELGEAPADWDYADYMYKFELPGEDGIDGAKPDGYRVMRLEEGIAMTPIGGTQGPNIPQGSYMGYDGNQYASDGTKADTAHFVNTYTKAAPAPASTPAPTEKPQSPKTGDEANLALWLALLGFGCLAAAVITRKKYE